MPFTHSFTFTPPKRYDGNPWTQVRVEASEDDSSFASVETLALDGSQVDPSIVDPDPTDPLARGITTEAFPYEEGYARVVWLDAGDDESPPSDSVLTPGSPSGASFASTDCVATRLGRTLSDAEEAMAEEFLLAATAVVAAECDKDDDWAASLSPVPELLRSVVCSLATREFANPQSVESYQESLGAYSYSQRFNASRGTLMLTEVERLLIRRAVYGSNAATTRPDSAFDELVELYETGEIPS